MVNIRCYKCGGKASGDTFEDARKNLNHAVGLSRGIKCGDNYNCVEEIVDKIKDPKALKPTETPKVETPEPVPTPEPIPETIPENDQNDSPIDTVEESAKPSKKKSKKFSY